MSLKSFFCFHKYIYNNAPYYFKKRRMCVCCKRVEQYNEWYNGNYFYKWDVIRKNGKTLK